MKLAARSVGYTIAGTDLLHEVDLDVPAGSRTALLGGNGSGKTTLLRLLYRGLPAQRGGAWIGGEPLWELPHRVAARHVGAVPQEQPADIELTVEEFVALGRLPHQRMTGGDGERDRAAVADAIGAADLRHLRHRPIQRLSGGERQRALVARALAQQADVLLLDEPTNHLDVAHQHELLALLRGLATTCVVALHDLNLAATYCDRAAVLVAGRVVAAGPVAEVLEPGVIADAFGVDATPVRHPVTGATQFLFTTPSLED